jgi:hypothetical protein
MSVSEPYDTPEATPRTDGPRLRMERTRRSRRGLRRGLGLLTGLIMLAMVGVLAYNVGTSYFALNGTWYGPLRVQVGPGRVSLEAYMDLATYLHGSLSGSGKLCSKNLLGGGTTSVDLRVAGSRNAGKVVLSFAGSTATLGIPLLSIALGPELNLHGSYTTSPSNARVAGILDNGVATEVTLSNGSSAFPVTLAMKRGVVAQFTSACTALSTLGDGSGARD